MLLFVLAATVSDILINFTVGYPAHVVLSLVEELGEMAGVTLILWGAYELCVFHGISVPAHSRSRPR